MDPNNVQLVPMVIGGTAGFIGGAVAALARGTTIRAVLVAILCGLGMGVFVAPAVVHWFTLPVEATGVVGFLSGLGAYGISTGITRLTDRFGENPESMLPESVRDRLGIKSPDRSPTDPKPKSDPPTSPPKGD